MTDSDEATAPLDPAPVLFTKLGIEITHVSADRVEGSMPVEGNTQPYGLLHGGATALLAETLGSMGAMEHAPDDSFAVGVDLNITHHRAVRDGRVHAVATALHLGRTVATYDVRVVDEAGKSVATARITCAIRRFTATLPKHH